MRLPLRAVCAATSSSSVDLPTPGSPASSTTAPGTSPPPSTRSSSGTPQDRDCDSSIGTWPIGTAAVVTTVGRARVAALPGATASTRLPQAWHSPHRPTHFGVSQPHSVHRWTRAGLAGWFDSWIGTLGDGADKPRSRHPRSRAAAPDWLT